MELSWLQINVHKMKRSMLPMGLQYQGVYGHRYYVAYIFMGFTFGFMKCLIRKLNTFNTENSLWRRIVCVGSNTFAFS